MGGNFSPFDSPEYSKFNPQQLTHGWIELGKRDGFRPHRGHQRDFVDVGEFRHVRGHGDGRRVRDRARIDIEWTRNHQNSKQQQTTEQF